MSSGGKRKPQTAVSNLWGQFGDKKHLASMLLCVKCHKCGGRVLGREVVYAVVNSGTVPDMYRPDPRWRTLMSQSVAYVYTRIFSPFLCAQGLQQRLSRRFCLKGLDLRQLGAP